MITNKLLSLNQLVNALLCHANLLRIVNIYYSYCIHARRSDQLVTSFVYEDLNKNNLLVYFILVYSLIQTNIFFQNANECFCGTGFGAGGPIEFSNCYKGCKGNEVQKCGSANAYHAFTIGLGTPDERWITNRTCIGSNCWRYRGFV